MKRLLTLLTAVLVVVLGGTPAGAATRAEPWTPAPCVSDVVLVDVNWDSSAGLLVLSGGAVQCEPAVADGGFRIATYTGAGDTGISPGWNIRLFDDTKAGAYRSFGVAAVPSLPGRYGVCVLGAGQERLTCGLAVVSRSGTAPPRALLAPLDTEDRMVAKPVVVGPYTGTLAPPDRGQPAGNCGTCF